MPHQHEAPLTDREIAMQALRAQQLSLAVQLSILEILIAMRASAGVECPRQEAVVQAVRQECGM